MAVVNLDVAVFGSTPLARLLAGLLASAHGMRVAIIGESDAAFRLAQGADLSVAPLTRPETWALLGHTVPETVRLLSRIGAKSGHVRIDPVFHARAPYGREALAHVRHVASGFGHAAERAPADMFAPGHEGLVIRDAVLLLRPQLEPLLDTWLHGLGVLALRGGQSRIAFTPEGRVSIAAGENGMEAERAVLADDDSIFVHLGHDALRHSAITAEMTSIFTEPTTPLPSPFVMEIEEGAHLLQRPSGSISAVAMGAAPLAVSVVGRLLARHQHLRRAGQVVFSCLVSRDGAPLVGRPANSGPLALAGLGLVGAFLAPALARWIAGAASPSEEAWITAHAIGRPITGSSVAEVLPPRTLEAVA
jgi:hypothetical protein